MCNLPLIALVIRNKQVQIKNMLANILEENTNANITCGHWRLNIIIESAEKLTDTDISVIKVLIAIHILNAFLMERKVVGILI